MKNFFFALALFASSFAQAQEDEEVAHPNKWYTEASLFGGYTLFNIERRTAGAFDFAAALERRKTNGFGFGLRANTMQWNLEREREGTTGVDFSGYPPAGFPFKSVTYYHYGQVTAVTPYASYNWSLQDYELGFILNAGAFFTTGSTGQDVRRIDSAAGMFQFYTERNYAANTGVTGGLLFRVAQKLGTKLRFQLQGGVQVATIFRGNSDFHRVAYFPIEFGVAYGFK